MITVGLDYRIEVQYPMDIMEYQQEVVYRLATVTSVFHKHQVSYHLYAHNKKQAYVSVTANNASLARDLLLRCISDISSWCASRRLQLNAAKTELIWFGSPQML